MNYIGGMASGGMINTSGLMTIGSSIQVLLWYIR
jgi:hypothetical protein